MSTMAAARPVGVTVVAVIATIRGIIAIFAGLGLVIERNSDSLLEQIDQGSGTVATYGVMAFMWGALALLVAWGLWTGGGWARILVAILEVLHVAGGVYLLFAWSGHYLWHGVRQILVGLFVLVVLFNPRADEFLEGRRA